MAFWKKTNFKLVVPSIALKTDKNSSNSFKYAKPDMQSSIWGMIQGILQVLTLQKHCKMMIFADFK